MRAKLSLLIPVMQVCLLPGAHVLPAGPGSLPDVADCEAAWSLPPPHLRDTRVSFNRGKEPQKPGRLLWRGGGRRTSRVQEHKARHVVNVIAQQLPPQLS